MISEVYNCDCLEYMRSLPDKYFDLCIADPPYGINADKKQKERSKKKFRTAKARSKSYGGGMWDSAPPGSDVFAEILRVSKHAIIWGANHFISRIPYDSSCWIVWDKDNGSYGYADCELAWTNYKSAVRKYTFRWLGMLQGDMKHKEIRIHPTQKPVALYSWLLDNYAKGGVKSSTHSSGVVAVA